MDTDMDDVPVEMPGQRPGKDATPFIERFPLRLAGAPISDVTQSMTGHQTPHDDGLDAHNIWSPFQTRRDWEFAQWAKNRGPSSTAVTELLAMDGVSLLCRQTHQELIYN
jgi:hypothetical protein